MTLWKALGGFLAAGAVGASLYACDASAQQDAVDQDPAPQEASADAAQTDPAPAPTPRDPSEVVCSINEEKITVADALTEFKTMMGPQAMQMPPEQLDSMFAQYEEQVVERMIESAVLRQAVEKAGVTCTEEEVNEVLAEISAQLPPDVTLEQQFASIGMTREQGLGRLRDNLKAKKYFDTLFVALPAPTAEEISAFYAANTPRFQEKEAVEARHVLVAVDAAADDAAKAEKRAAAEEVRAKLVAEGSDFAQIAGEHSDCPSKAEGGNLGKFGRGQMVGPFEEAAFALPVNQISDIVETQFGFHIIEVTARQEARTVPLEEASESISEELLGGKKNELVQKKLADLRAAAKIVRPGEAAVPIPANETAPAGATEGNNG